MQQLLQPLKLGPVEIPNRVALAPMDLGFESFDETWPERFMRYVEERCRGEVGLIITHFTRATLLASSPIVGIYDDRFLDTHTRLADLVHRYDSRIFLQIAAQGGKGGGAAPSAIVSPNYPDVPRQLAVEEIEHIIQDFARAAVRARRAGYDGVELHGAHTYLVGAFVSPHTNRRQDAYGGDFERRMRFPVEIVQAIKREVGEDFPVGFKFSAWEELAGGVTPELAVRVAQRMAQAGVCYLHVASTSSTLGLTSRYPSVPTLYTPANVLLPLARRVKQAVKDVPIVATGAIGEPGDAEAMIASGDCDMVALGRALLADPHWVRKARQGQRVRPCIRCNVCYQQLREPNAPLICTVNPYLTLETQEPLPPISMKKRVLVVGGGPGGMVAALTAAQRGHQVTLYEEKSALGGELIPGSQPPFKSEVGRLLRYWREEVADSSIEVRLDTEVTPDLVRREHPDALVVAVGATSLAPAIPGVDAPNVMMAVDALLEPARLMGKDVIILGGGDVGCECAVFLAQQGCQVTLVEALDELLLVEEVHSIKTDLLQMLDDAGVTALTDTQALAIEERGVTLRSPDGSRHFLAADWIVLATGMAPLSQVAHRLAGECGDVHLIGDCRAPRRIRDAVVEGDLAGRLI
jgi:2,4-dienoyl-CoA reductase-like NADH-dependent reductase (Old Yellow Enzyme family)/thioredoxin reductase